MKKPRLAARIPRKIAMATLLALLGAGPLAARGKTAIAPASAPKTIQPATPTAGAAGSSKLERFVRIEGEEIAKEGRLQVARAVLRHPAGKQRVILEGVVHMGERGYYATMQKRLAGYDRVLYEFVRPAEVEGNIVPAFDGSSLSLVGMLSSSLGLVHQMEGLDYDQPNFLWADLDTAEFSKLAGMKSVSELSLIGAVVGSTLKNGLFGGATDSAQAQSSSWGFHEDLLAIQGHNEFGSREAKWFLARQLVRAQGMGMEALDPELRNALAGAREDRALEVMEKVFRESPDAKVGILYGAGHMPNFHQKLLERGYVHETVEWDEAWKF